MIKKPFCAPWEILFRMKDSRCMKCLLAKLAYKMALSTHPDIILLDLPLPSIGGIDVLKRLRADAWGKHAEVILLTNIDRDVKVMADAVELGAYEYLVESHWQISDVIKKVKDKIGVAS